MTPRLGESPEKLPSRNNHFENRATEKLGGLGRHICTTFADIPKNHCFRLASDKCHGGLRLLVFAKDFNAPLKGRDYARPFEEKITKTELCRRLAN
ncbi:hypothetical protein L0337_45925 [candidate division KSB1 bacterium]|nr:hypothetical protein [candidate division KSB1 bacterium]